MGWEPTEQDIERRNRIRLSIAAAAYEFFNSPVMSDAEFDELALKIRPEMSTGDRPKDKVHDKFFREEFEPDTGQWIHDHPFLPKVKAYAIWLMNER